MLPCHSMCHLRGRIPGTSECICPLACDLGLGTLHLLPWKSLRYSVCLCEPRNPNKVRSPLSMCLSIYSKNFNKVVSCNFLYQSYPNVYLGYHPLLIHTLPVLHWIFFFFLKIGFKHVTFPSLGTQTVLSYSVTEVTQECYFIKRFFLGHCWSWRLVIFQFVISPTVFPIVVYISSTPLGSALR